MRAWLGWIVVLAVALVMALLVDHGERTFGVPDWFWMALNMTVFLYLLHRFVGRPIAAYLDTRRDGIAADLEQAAAKLAEAERMRGEVMARLEEVDQEVAAIRRRAEAEGTAEAEAIAEQSEREQARFLTRVDDEITRRHAEVRQSLARETAELTARLTRDLLSDQITPADRGRVFDRSVTALEALQEKE